MEEDHVAIVWNTFDQKLVHLSPPLRRAHVLEHSVKFEIVCDQKRSPRRFKVLAPRIGNVAAAWPEAKFEGDGVSEKISIHETLEVESLEAPNTINLVLPWLESRMVIMRAALVD